MRRPISICDYDDRSIALIYKVVGEGTEQMSRHAAGRSARPADRVWATDSRREERRRRETLLVGRRRGRPAALQPGETAPGRRQARCRWCWASTPRRRSSTRRSSARWAAAVAVSTVDGSRGVGASSPTAIAEQGLDFDYFYACGPLPMLHAL
ncbi:MAG: hypothetical protein ACLUNS_07680 [Alistipes shahii]